jgi:bifunctional UDP-N-acetylglucosamine pyrophosphorylase / glucosamine-1-phosphate N-acetyltransferase
VAEPPARIRSLNRRESNLAKTLEVAIVLAAGEGTRMKSETPKVLHFISGKTIIDHVISQVSKLSPGTLRVVVGAARDSVEEHIKQIAPTVEFIFQAERNGTGHAVQVALADLKIKGTVLICAGDTPLLRSETLAQFIDVHSESKNTVSVLTAQFPDPTGYGRILRNEADEILAIIEELDAPDEIKMIDEINTGVYLFDIDALRTSVAKLKSDNSQGELYLTDVIADIKASGGRAAAILSNDYSETLGINDRSQLAECAAIMRDRINYEHMINGVEIIDPTTTWIDASVEIDSDATIFPESWLAGTTKIGSKAIIGPRTTLMNVKVGSSASVIESNCVDCTIGAGASVGPYSYLRAGTNLGEGAKAGAFVEIKNSTIGEGSKIPHLSYVGDAEIGSGTNIGAATVFVNYDGVEKHKTKIGDEVRIGSDTMLVAPVSIGDGAYTAAGSVITDDIPAGAMGFARSKQRNILGWVLRKRSGTKSAQVAKAAGANESSEQGS